MLGNVSQWLLQGKESPDLYCVYFRDVHILHEANFFFFLIYFIIIIIIFCLYFFFLATPAAYGRSQARG